MIKTTKFLAIVATLFILTSCGIHGTLSRYQNVHSTTARVDLNKANFKVIGYTKGSAKCSYVFGIGGLKKKMLLENARSEMYANANLTGAARVLLNENIDVKSSGFWPFYIRNVVTVSGYVYEFQQ